MAQPPLALSVQKLTPLACIPQLIPTLPLTPVPSPSESISIPSPPSSFGLSPSPHYAGPFGNMSLGETIRTHVILSNISQEMVAGVKMMIEVQGPNGRYKLGELVNRHSGLILEEGGKDGSGSMEMDLQVGGEVALSVESEMKDVGLNVLICSVAWETPEGRRTFQRFLKFNVTPPLAIKTRIHTPANPNVLLDPARRSDLHLEVLVQNTSMTGLVFDKVQLEPVKGLISRSASDSELLKLRRSFPESETLFPDDTRQYLFTLSPDIPTDGMDPRQSVFPAAYTPGSILPLGRLDMAWFSAPHREAGRLQTSTLNRRVPQPVAPARPILPSRGSASSQMTNGLLPPAPTYGGEGWEYDLALVNCPRQVEIEREFTVNVRVALRSKSKPDDAPRLAVQYLTHERIVSRRASTSTITPKNPNTRYPTFALSPPPPSTASSSRPFSPLDSSRPMTPVSHQLRQATSSNIQSQTSATFPNSNNMIVIEPAPPAFPPPPFLPYTHAGPSKTKPTPKGQIVHLGSSLSFLPVKEVEKVRVDHGVTYDETVTGDDERWEVVHELSLRFMALDDGLCELGGIRVLHVDGHTGVGGSVGRQWDSLGDLWVVS